VDGKGWKKRSFEFIQPILEGVEAFPLCWDRIIFQDDEIDTPRDEDAYDEEVQEEDYDE
jgi:hypothetical protein